MSRLFQRLRKLGLNKRVLANEETIPRRGTLTPCPLSFAQQRLWFLDQLESGNPVYHISAAIRCTGPLSMAAVEQSLNEIVTPRGVADHLRGRGWAAGSGHCARADLKVARGGLSGLPCGRRRG
jgi:Condensation domain